MMVYITLLVLLGPLLQAKSHHKALHWVNRIKPFLDAFYGPYISWYRYWPGILLLARLVTLVVFSSFYDDSNLKLVMASVIVLVLLFISTLFGKVHTYRKRLSLEFSYLLNLGIFMVVSVCTYKTATFSCAHAGTSSGSVWHYIRTSYIFSFLSSLQGRCTLCV